MASTGRFWKPGHGTVQFSSSSAYDLAGLGSGKDKARGGSGNKAGAAARGGGLRPGSSKDGEGLSSRVKGMKFMQRDSKVQADLDAAAALEASAAAARSSESWSLGLPAGPLVGGASGGLRCVADDHAAPSVAPASAASGKVLPAAGEGVAVAAPGRASYGKFNKSLEALVKERERADKRKRDADDMDDVGVSDSEMAAVLGHSRAKAKGLSGKARRQRIREADDAVADASAKRKDRKAAGKRRKAASRG